MAIKLVLSSKEILNKTFKVAPKGYNAFEVDEFLDKILRDYQTIEKNYLVEADMVKSLETRIKTLEDENKDLSVELSRYKKKFQNIKENDNVTESNIDLVKKINIYEKFLWNHGFNPKTIK